MKSQRPAEVWDKLYPFALRSFEKIFQKNSDKGKVNDDYLILLYDVSAEKIKDYSYSASGLAGANMAAASGDVIFIPPGTLTGNYTVKAGVAWVGLSRAKTILTGCITGAADSCIERLSIVRTANDAADLIGVEGQASGTFYVKDCDVTVTQSGAGLACGLRQNAAGLVMVWNTLLDGTSTGGDGYGSYRTDGAIIIDGGATLGSTAAIYDP